MKTGNTKPAAAAPGFFGKFVNGLILAFLVCVVAGGLLYNFPGWGKWKPADDPAGLVRQAREGLEAVKKRDLKTTMQPAKYDSILMPLDELLREINLKEFGKAEDALVKAKDLAAEAYARAGETPGGEYLTALMNLADFHDALAYFYGRETRMNPTNGNDRELRRHRGAADQYAAEIRRYTPFDFPAERELRGE